MGWIAGRESRAGRRQSELSRDEHRPDAWVRENREIFASRDRAQVRPNVRAHSTARSHGARAPDVATGESAPRGVVKSFEYLRPESLQQLLTLMRLHGSGARLLAGGTDLLVRMRKGAEPPRAVIDLKRVAELRDDIVESNGVIRIGARAVMTDVIGNPSVRQHCPALVEAAMVVGSIQIRNR